jgi:hypothetical protein
VIEGSETGEAVGYEKYAARPSSVEIFESTERDEEIYALYRWGYKSKDVAIT